MRRKGQEGFIAFYKEEWGPRFESLCQSLMGQKKWFIRRNHFASRQETETIHPFKEATCLPVHEPCEGYETSQKIDIPPNQGTSVTPWYPMDLGSVYPPLVLASFFNRHNSFACLDMCAAPGGKSLILAEHIFPSDSTLVLNELSPDRMKRLKDVCRNYIPKPYLERVTFRQSDGRLLAKFQPGQFDYILLDTPCSSEQHVLNSPQHLDQWNEIRIQRMQQTQLGLLKSALTLLKAGGIVVYSTCALNRFENDTVIEKTLTHKKISCHTMNDGLQVGEKTTYGRWFLPDVSGMGPIYLAVLQKDPT